jgi:hypothetical protein
MCLFSRTGIVEGAGRCACICYLARASATFVFPNRNDAEYGALEHKVLRTFVPFELPVVPLRAT